MHTCVLQSGLAAGTRCGRPLLAIFYFKLSLCVCSRLQASFDPALPQRVPIMKASGNIQTRTRGASNGAVAKVLQSQNPGYSVKKDAVRSRAMRRQQELYSELQFAPVSLPCTELDKVIRWHVPSVAALLKWHAENNVQFKCALKDCLKTHDPSKPLRLVVYCDECTPGNVLHPDNQRKSWLWFTGVLDFDKKWLCKENVWIPTASLLSWKSQATRGGLSTIQRILLQHFLAEVPSVFRGFSVDLDGEPVFLRFVLKPFIFDEDAQKKVWGVKGSSGKKPCLHCNNIVSKATATRRSDLGLLPITEPDANKFDLSTNQDLWDMADHLATKKHVLGKCAFEKLQTDSGLNFLPEGVLACKELREHLGPTDSRYDPMHVFFSNGIAGHEIDLFVARLVEQRLVSCESLTEFCRAGWRCEKRLFARKFKDGELKGMAGDVLFALPMLRYFAEVVVAPRGRMQAEIASFGALYDVVACYQRLKLNGATDNECNNMQQLQHRHYKLFLATYSETCCRPKHHMSLHIPDQIRRDGKVFDAFVLERKMRLFKAEMKNV